MDSYTTLSYAVNFNKKGPLGVTLVSSPTDFVIVQKTLKYDGKTIAKGNVLSEIDGDVVLGISFDDVMKRLRQCGRPVTLSFLKVTGPEQRMTYYGSETPITDQEDITITPNRVYLCAYFAVCCFIHAAGAK